MVRVIWTPAALEDLIDIKNFIADNSTLYALEEMGRIFAAADSLQEFPLLGKLVSQKFKHPIRQIISGNYRIVYRIIEDVAEVLSVTHGSRQMDLDKRILEPETNYGNSSALIYTLTPEEEAKVKKGLKDIQEGRTYTHEEIKKMVDDWFKDLP